MAGYKIKSGDTLSQIAKKNGMTLKALLGANPGIKNANKIRVGQSIKVPSTSMLPGSKSNDPYKGIQPAQMRDMDVKNKSEKRQRRATRSMQSQVKDGGSRYDPTPSEANKIKDQRSGNSAMLERARAKQKAAKPTKAAAKKMNMSSGGSVDYKYGGGRMGMDPVYKGHGGNIYNNR